MNYFISINLNLKDKYFSRKLSLIKQIQEETEILKRCVTSKKLKH